MNSPNGPPHPAEHDAETSTSKSIKMISSLTQLGPSLSALLAGCLYVVGFLVLNSNLVQYGVTDFDFINARYFLAGATFVFFLSCFYLFAGRVALFGPRWLRQDMERLSKARPNFMWRVILPLHSIVSVVFYCSLSAALFTSIAIGTAETFYFYGALSLGFFIIYTIDVANFDVKFPRTSEIMNIVIKLIAVYVFFANIGSGSLLAVFSIYVLMLLYVNFVIDRLDRYRVTGDTIAFNVFYSIVFVLVVSTSFGALLYGDINARLGGARPQPVSLVLLEDTRRALPPQFVTLPDQTIQGALVHQTSSFLYITSGGYTLRLRTADVSILLLEPTPKQIFGKNFFLGSAP
jgi:hypothetical protein